MEENKKKVVELEKAGDKEKAEEIKEKQETAVFLRKNQKGRKRMRGRRENMGSPKDNL